MAQEIQILNIEACSGLVCQAIKRRWPDSGDVSPDQILPSFWRRAQQRAIYLLAEEVARSRKAGLIGRPS